MRCYFGQLYGISILLAYNDLLTRYMLEKKIRTLYSCR
jgi:hypothetical protein